MTLPVPWIAYGEITDSNGNKVSSVPVTASADTSTTAQTNEDGKYFINLMDYASSGGTITISCKYNGESSSSSFTLVLSDPGKQTDLSLEEANNTNDIAINACYSYNSEQYVFSPWIIESYQKTMDI